MTDFRDSLIRSPPKWMKKTPRNRKAWRLAVKIAVATGAAREEKCVPWATLVNLWKFYGGRR